MAQGESPAATALRASARQQADAFLAGDIQLRDLFRWVDANRRAVYEGRDDDTRSLVDKMRATIEAVLRGRIEEPGARDHLRMLMRERERDDAGPGRF